MSDLKLTDASVQVKKSTCDLKYTHAVRGAEHNRPQDRADGPKVNVLISARRRVTTAALLAGNDDFGIRAPRILQAYKRYENIKQSALLHKNIYIIFRQVYFSRTNVSHRPINNW